VARGIEREGGTRQPMRLTVIGTVGEPLRQHAKIGRAVTAPAAALIDGGDGAEQLRNRRARLRAQCFGLRRRLPVGDEPQAQAAPTFAPGTHARL
jgi:hypothetical protein